ncbi:phosphodiester glycosidase family protein [Pseudanabaenaceae cyanobacterium LEGE 13415]|nr:phosphodiester glycosidase family protein [Pseudanabaenaceae cyanobacterium LEGE 13415]
MQHRDRANFRKIVSVLVLILLMIPIALYSRSQFSRPPRTDETRSLFPGITYERQALSEPRPVMLHQVSIDLTTPGIRPFVTPGIRAVPPNRSETQARTVTEFVDEFYLQLGVNANFFEPFREETPWDFYPKVGQSVNNLGQVTSNGNNYSPAQAGWSVVCFLPQNRVQFDQSGFCPKETEQAVAGNDLLVKDGKPVPPPPHIAPKDKPYSRTVIAIDKSGKKLWLILVDGKQLQYSEGLTYVEMSDYLMRLGAQTALNLDGGGSVTLAVQTPTGAKVLNAPIQSRIPMRERPVASHLGFFAPKNSR